MYYYRRYCHIFITRLLSYLLAIARDPVGASGERLPGCATPGHRREDPGKRGAWPWALLHCWAGAQADWSGDLSGGPSTGPQTPGPRSPPESLQSALQEEPEHGSGRQGGASPHTHPACCSPVTGLGTMVLDVGLQSDGELLLQLVHHAALHHPRAVCKEGSSVVPARPWGQSFQPREGTLPGNTF